MKKLLAILACSLGFVQAYGASKEATPVIQKVKGGVFSGIHKVDDAGGRGDCLRIEGDKLYCGGGSTLYVYDIANPAEPRQLGKCKIKGLCRQVTSNNGMVYVGSRETGLWIIDAKNPSEPKVIKRYDAVELATGVDVVGNLLLLGLRQNGVEFVDVTDPYNPQHIFLQKTPESQSVWYNDGIVYSGEWGRGQVTMIDASDLSNINVIGKVQMNGYGDGIYTNGKYLYAATGHSSLDKSKSSKDNEGKGHALEVIDISDPANPVQLSRTQFEDCYKRGYFDFWTARPNGDNTICFVADTFNGLYAVDVKKPTNTKIIGRITFDTAEGEHTPVTSVAVGNGVVYATAAQAGLFVVTCKKAKVQQINRGKMPENLSYRSPYSTTSESHFLAWQPSSRAQVRGVATKGDVIYAACSDAGLAILKQASDGSLKQIGEGKAAFAGDVKVMGNRLFVAEGLDGLAIYEIKGETELEEISRVSKITKDIDWCLWVWALSEEYIAASGRYAGVSILDIRDINNIKQACHFSLGAGWDKYIPDKLCADNMLAYLRPHSGICWMKVNDSKILYQDKKNFGHLMNGISNYKDGRIIVTKGDELRILEPGKKYDSNVSGFKIKRMAGAPQWDGGNKVSVTARIGRKVALVDYSDDNAPKLLFEEQMEGNPEIPTFFKGKLLVPCGYQGLLLQK